MTTTVLPVILIDKSDTPLWSLSRTGFNKQFLILSGTYSFIQQA